MLGQGGSGPSPSPSPVEPVSSPLRPAWQLRVLTGPLRGTVLLLRDRFGIGRSSGSDLQLSHEAVSRQHALIAIDGEDRPVLVDLVSSNGTFVDGRPVEREILRPHAIVRVADTELVFEPAAERGATERVHRGEQRVPVALRGPDGAEQGGQLLDEIVEYRMLRARERRGGLSGAEERARFEALTGQLRQPPEAGLQDERRAFWRFSCGLPATLRLASSEELPCEVRDLGVDGARVELGSHELEFDEIVWLGLVLEASGQVREHVLPARVAWVGATGVGMAFAGAPRSAERVRAVSPEGFDHEAPTQRIDVSPGATQSLGLVIGSARSRARHWPEST